MRKTNSMTKACNTAVLLFDGRNKKSNKTLEKYEKILLKEQQGKFAKFH